MRKHMEQTAFYTLLVKANLLFFHFEKREHRVKMGDKNPDKTFYVIRGCGKEAGLFALYISALNDVYRCLGKGWIPVIDLREDRTQYNEDYPVRGSIWNAWEYYFAQPSEYTLEEVYQSRNVVWGGWKLFGKGAAEKIWDGDKLFSGNEIRRIHAFAMEYGKIQPDIKQKIADEKKRVFGDKEKLLGVSVRGTDYLAFKPKGHSVQPPLEDVISKAREFIEKYPKIEGIFLTTEDDGIYRRFQQEFGDLILTSNANRIKDYDQKGYITTKLRKNSKYEQGLEYLIEKSLLAECEYLVATRAAGADYAVVVNGGRFSDKYIFDLGKY